MTKELSCGVEFMRGILLILNVLFIIVGIALIAIGIYVKVDNKFAALLNEIASETTFDGQSLGFLAYMMIIVGVITLLIALFGCIGKFLDIERTNAISFISLTILCLKAHYGTIDAYCICTHLFSLLS
jgi:hypothetical protein